MGRFLDGHFYLLIGLLTVVLWIGALGWYIGPDIWRHWQARHTRWLDRD